MRVRQANAISLRIFRGTVPIWYAIVLFLSCLWAIFNCAYVYLALGGGRTYRIESSVMIFVALLLPAVLIARNEERGSEFPRAALWAMASAAVAIWLAFMVPLVDYPFLSDDYVFLGRYRTWSDLWRIQALFRPVFALLFWTGAVIGRGSTIPFHILAFVLHLACAVLVALLVRRIVGSLTSAVVAFALFLVSPLQLEATLWVSGLQELLCAFFVLSAAVIYSRGDEATLKRALAATPTIVLALLSKETAVGYLVLFPMLDVALGRIRRVSIAARSYLLLGALAVTYLIVRSRFTVPDPDFLAEPSRYFLKQFVTLPYKFFVQPWNAEAVGVPLIVSFALCAVALAWLLVSVLAGRLTRVSLAGPVIVIAFTLPLYTYFFVAPDLMAARYLYLPFVGWALLLAHVMTSTLRRPAIIGVVLGVIVAGSLFALRLNQRPWRTVAGVMAVMESALQRGLDPLETARVWEEERSIHLTRRGSVPVEFQGVYILLNGYDEFVQFSTVPAFRRR